MSDRLTGKQSYFYFNGYFIPITKATPKTSRKLADITDNGDYDTNTDLLWPTQLPVMAPVELSIEGRFRKSTIPGAILSILYTGATAVQTRFGLDTNTIYGSGLFDLSDFQADSPVDDVVTFTCTVRSNGKFTPLS